jgi:hypothetical protein
MDFAEHDPKSSEGMRELNMGHCAARGFELRLEPPSEPLYGRPTGTDTESLPDSSPEVRSVLDPESQTAFKRPTTRNDSFLISSLTKFGLGFRVGYRVGHRVALRGVLGATAGAGLGNGIDVERDAVLRGGPGEKLHERFLVPHMMTNFWRFFLQNGIDCHEMCLLKLTPGWPGTLVARSIGNPDASSWAPSPKVLSSEK